jgi:hypothetical protein
MLAKIKYCCRHASNADNRQRAPTRRRVRRTPYHIAARDSRLIAALTKSFVQQIVTTARTSAGLKVAFLSSDAIHAIEATCR